MKNAGTVVPKVLANLSVAALCYWAVGFALAFGRSGWFAGTEGTFLGTLDGELFPAMSFSAATVPAKFFFQFVFCAVSLAIVWGTTLERIKFGAYLITRSSSALGSTRSSATGSSAAAGCRRASGCRTSPARPWCT